MDVCCGWTDGWTDWYGWMDAQLMGQMDGQYMDYGRRVSGWMDGGWMVGHRWMMVSGWIMDGWWMDRCMDDRWTDDRWTGGKMDGIDGWSVKR